MANHNLPTLAGTTYADFLSQISARLTDVAQGMDPAVTTVTNPPLNAIRWTGAGNTWQKWSGTAWVAWTNALELPATTATASGAGAALRAVQNGAGAALSVESGGVVRLLIASDGTVSGASVASLTSDDLPALSQLVAMSTNTSLVYKGRILAGVDLNAIYEPGIYRINSGVDAAAILNAPASTSGGTLEVLSPNPVVARGLRSLVVQRYTQRRPERVFVRESNSFSAEEWSSWKEFALTGMSAPLSIGGDMRTSGVLAQASVPTNTNTSATLTAASLRQGLRTGTPTAAITYTLPTGANMDLAFTSLENNMSFEWSVINLATATHTITLAAATGHTVVGSMVVQPNTSGRFLTRKTAADTFITYRIA